MKNMATITGTHAHTGKAWAEVRQGKRVLVTAWGRTEEAAKRRALQYVARHRSV